MESFGLSEESVRIDPGILWEEALLLLELLVLGRLLLDARALGARVLQIRMQLLVQPQLTCAVGVSIGAVVVDSLVVFGRVGAGGLLLLLLLLAILLLLALLALLLALGLGRQRLVDRSNALCLVEPLGAPLYQQQRICTQRRCQHTTRREQPLQVSDKSVLGRHTSDGAES